MEEIITVWVYSTSVVTRTHSDTEPYKKLCESTETALLQLRPTAGAERQDVKPHYYTT